jgi:cell division protein FtsQ
MKRVGKKPSTKRNKAGARKRGPSRIWKLTRSVRSWLFGGFLLALMLAAMGLVFPYLYDYLVSSPYLKLETVTMEGADAKLQEELTQLCGIRKGTSILALRLNEIKKTMESHPWVRSVKIERRFPDQLWIRVEKQEPFAMVLSNGLHYFNRWGEVFKPVQDRDSIDFPIVTGLEVDEAATPGCLKRAVAVMDALKAESGECAISNLSEINLEDEGGLSLYFKTLKAEVRLTESDASFKMDEFKKIVDHLKSIGRLEEATLIDLNYEYGGVVSFKNGGCSVGRKEA